MKKKMPVSHAKTGYSLLGEIRRIILAEPRRYDQYETLMRGRDLRIRVDPEYRPECGTIGCVAGWVKALKRPSTSIDAIDFTQRILGLDNDQTTELTSSSAAGQRRLSDLVSHAERGAEHIERFRQKYAKQLKAKRV